jgi:hypothetical protein
MPCSVPLFEVLGCGKTEEDSGKKGSESLEGKAE